MATTTEAESSSAEPIPSNESKAQQQARLRRDRRNAKIQAGGNDRLNKITTMSGRPAAAEAELEKSRSRSPNPPQSAQLNQAHVDDPDEVDISSVPQGSTNLNQAQSQQEMMRQFLRGTGAEGQTGNAGKQGEQQPENEDPMMRMMQQVMGSMGGQSGPQGPDPQMQAFSELFGAASSQQEPAFSNYDNIWRTIHSLCAFALAFYALSTCQLVGSKLARSDMMQTQTSPPLFWIFTTVQLVLQSSRYFLEGGRPPPSGLLATAGRWVPDPYGNYLRILSRYRVIYNTIISDALVVIFVLGCAAWWKGLAAS
ncbi:MAG: hypothetical protein M1828_007465 [Chrysothrix sp. TS-e1954]|nr:MAG: hypothetical protein M1828_007465 [Chrysothrix sp. TS-e1954]